MASFLGLRTSDNCPRCAMPIDVAGSPCPHCAQLTDAQASLLRRRYEREIKPLRDLKLVVKTSLIVMILATFFAYFATGGH